MKVSIKSISEKTGFSPATVSNALNHKKGVNAETAAEIFRVARELGYISEIRISKVKFVIFRGSGKIIDNSPFLSAMIDGVEKGCRQFGLEMTICNLSKHDITYREDVERLIHDSASAVIFLGTELMEEDVGLYKGADCPFVMLDYWAWDMSFNGVLINNKDSAGKAVEYLIEKGHREIGYLRGDFRIKAFRSREMGYEFALKNAGIPVKNEYIVTLGTDMNTAYRGMTDFLKKRPKLPTAYYVDNDMIAIGAMRALQESGYRIPEDVSLIGFDNLPFSEICFPPLTTIDVPNKEMGLLAVKRVVDVIKGDKIKTKMQVCTSFIERSSVLDRREM